MAKNTKGDGSLEQNGSTVVTPDNMGKGLTYNTQTNQYDVSVRDSNGVKVNPDGSVGLALSPDAGNQIELRNNGIYYGSAAKKEIRNLYVSSRTGSDSNDGSRNAPLKTLAKALSLLEDKPVTYDIWLAENEEFELDQRFYPAYANINLHVYGATVDSTYPDYTPLDAFFRGYMAKNYPRAIVNVRNVVYSDIRQVVRGALGGRNIQAFGLHIKVYNKAVGNDSADYSGDFTGIFSADEVSLVGCVVESIGDAVTLGRAGNYRNDVYFRGNVRWINSKFIVTNSQFNKLASANYSTKFNLIGWNLNTVNGYGAAPDYESLNTTDSFWASVTKDNFTQVVTYNGVAQNLSTEVKFA